MPRTASKLWSCPQCGKTFTRSFILKMHMHEHTGERPYSCVVCSQTFRRNNECKVHEKSHTKERRFSCESCGKRFTRKTGLTAHGKTRCSERNDFCQRQKNDVTKLVIPKNDGFHTLVDEAASAPLNQESVAPAKNLQERELSKNRHTTDEQRIQHHADNRYFASSNSSICLPEWIPHIIASETFHNFDEGEVTTSEVTKHTGRVAHKGVNQNPVPAVPFLSSLPSFQLSGSSVPSNNAGSYMQGPKSSKFGASSISSGDPRSIVEHAFISAFESVRKSDSEWFKAVRSSDLRKLEYLRKHENADLNARDNNLRTALHLAARNHQKGIFYWLLSHGALVNLKDENGNTALHLALCNRQNVDYDIVQALVSHKSHEKIDFDVENENRCTPLFLALKSRGTNLVFSHDRKESILHRMINSTSKLCQKTDEGSLLHTAILQMVLDNCTFETIKLLIRRGTPLHLRDGNGRTPLILASILLDRGLLDALPSTNADQTGYRDTLGILSHTLNYYQIFKGNELIKYLIESNGNMAARDHLGNTVLHYVLMALPPLALPFQSGDMLLKLLNALKRPDLKNSERHSLLEIALGVLKHYKKEMLSTNGVHFDLFETIKAISILIEELYCKDPGARIRPLSLWDAEKHFEGRKLSAAGASVLQRVKESLDNRDYML